MQAAATTKKKTARFADGPGLVMLVPADLDVSQRSVGSSVTADDDVVVLEAAPFHPWQQQQHARTKTLLKYDEMTTPMHGHDETNALERTLDIGQVLTARRRVVLGQNPVVTTAKHRVLNTLAIVSLCFFAVSGGPVSTETAISSGGPLLGLVGYAVFPLLFNLPITFVIAELCSAFPEDGGFAMWILSAWGPFWGFLEGYWAWFRSVLDRAIYIHALFYFLSEAFGFSVDSSVVRYLIKAGLAVSLTLPSLFGARLVTFILASLFAVVLVVFGIFSVWGLSVSDSMSQFGDIRLTSIELFDSENVSIDGGGSSVSDATSAVLSGGWDISVPTYINSLFWNLDGFYLASVFGGEVRNPARTYPRAFLISFLVMWLVYVVPTFAAVAANRPHWSTWEDSSIVETISTQIGGSALHTIVLVGAVVGLCGMYLAELFCEVFQISGMAECGLAPGVFQKRDVRFDMPRLSIAFSLVAVLACLPFDSDRLVDVTNAFSAIVELLIIATAIRLRHTLPYLTRPTKVPGGMTTLCLVMLLPVVLLGYLLVETLLKPSSALIFGVVTVIGAIGGLLQQRRLDSMGISA